MAAAPMPVSVWLTGRLPPARAASAPAPLPAAQCPHLMALQHHANKTTIKLMNSKNTKTNYNEMNIFVYV